MDFIGDTILVIGAHSDDAEISMGGTISKFLKENKRVVIAIYALSTPLSTRQKEAEKGAGILGAELRFMSYDSRQVSDVHMKDIVSDIDNLISDIKPSTIFTHNSGDFHLDHRMLNEAVHSSSRKGTFNLIHFENSSLCAIPLNKFSPNFYVDITNYFENKIEAIKAHTSQINIQNLLNDYKIRASYHGATINTKYAEAFLVSKLICI